MRTQLLLLGALALFSAAFYTETASPRQSKDYRKLGDSLSTQAQQHLLQHLSGAIEKGGAAYAVDFCNEQAPTLTNASAKNSSVKIQRISAKNRNPDNAASLFDRQILALFEAGQAPLKDTLVSIAKGYVYYKPIKIGMPLCLQCHGQPKQDIEAATLKTIKQKYRFDKATGYQTGELRGAWKLTFMTD